MSDEPSPAPGEAEPPVPAAAASGRRRRLWMAPLTIVAALVAAALLGAGWLLMAYAAQPGPGRGRVVELQIAEGEGLAAIAARLAEAGALEAPRSFEVLGRLRGAEPRLRRGAVLVRDSMTPGELLARVAAGLGSVELRLTIPEGQTRHELARRLARWGICTEAEFLRASAAPELLAELGIDGPSAEGWLFPDTYRVRDDSGAERLLRRLVENARRRFEPLKQHHAAALAELSEQLDMDFQQVLALASIVEREAVLAREQPVIAGVFLNRLRSPDFRPKRLQADPTVAYGCLEAGALPSCRGFDGRRITRQMLDDAQNPYNTYRIDGLPPGPIGNPGLGAIEAVLDPARHDYLYFVARGDSSHVFSATLEAHLEAVARYRQRASR
ncbi:MAG: endolytic transglycosylase MltG [Myxococcales bacterium]|nr:endolytic transglycosylase MltG [Myxococcales bacterium]